MFKPLRRHLIMCMYCALRVLTLSAVIYFIKVKGRAVREFFSQKLNTSCEKESL